MQTTQKTTSDSPPATLNQKAIRQQKSKKIFNHSIRDSPIYSPKGMMRVPVLGVVRRVRQQRLDALERHQHRLDRTGRHARNALGHVLVHAAPLDEWPPRPVVHAEHHREGDCFLRQRGEDPPVEERDALAPDLPEGLVQLDAVQHLAEYHLVDRVRDGDVDEGRAPTARKLLPAKERDSGAG